MSAPAASSGFRVVEWSRMRNPVVDLLEVAHRQHNISAAWEVDFTEAWTRMGKIRRATGVAVSLNAYLVHALAHTAQQHPMMQAVRWRSRGKVALYDGVDVGTPIEWTQRGQPPVAVGARISDAHAKSLAQICVEMRRLAKEDPRSRPLVQWRAKIGRYPAWVRRLIWTWIDAHPERRRKFRGTIALTNLNFLLDERQPVFGFPLSPYTTTLCVGSIYPRAMPDPAAPHGVVFRRFLALTMTVDHDLLDGGLAARFARTLTFYLEAAGGLDDAFAAELRAAFPGKARAE